MGDGASVAAQWAATVDGALAVILAKAGIVLTEIKENKHVPTDRCTAPWGLTVLTKQPKNYIWV